MVQARLAKRQDHGVSGKVARSFLAIRSALSLRAGSGPRDAHLAGVDRAGRRTQCRQRQGAVRPCRRQSGRCHQPGPGHPLAAGDPDLLGRLRQERTSLHRRSTLGHCGDGLAAGAQSLRYLVLCAGAAEPAGAGRRPPDMGAGARDAGGAEKRSVALPTATPGGVVPSACRPTRMA